MSLMSNYTHTLDQNRAIECNCKSTAYLFNQLVYGEQSLAIVAGMPA